LLQDAEMRRSLARRAKERSRQFYWKRHVRAMLEKMNVLRMCGQ